ncbi:hypothetical protein Cflav_PD5940 [Pedosphaera parvula Ellin514]|uniref:Uncharacterized protein n=1 Tax=Pedosphaera parvula (strain Ellin514) TaxID=320771 RepID=B9X9W4_PEDPL|nr:hypothetical protein Cflav_PD5940 [Pedosphaera parvula Ellin514]
MLNGKPSKFPYLMAHWQAIQHHTVELPLENESVHKGEEPGVVCWFQQVSQFVDH